jgi:hypothetical protein
MNNMFFGLFKNKEKESYTSSNLNEEDTQSMTRRRQRELENMLLEFALEAYKNKNFSTEFRFDRDREDKEFEPNFPEIIKGSTDDYETKILERLKNGSVVIIEQNGERSSSRFSSEPHNDWKNGGLDFTIYTKNDEGHILKYAYKNLHWDGGIKSEFNLYMSVYNNEYHKYTDLDPEYSFSRRWSNSELSVDAEVKRMKKLEKLVMLMVDEQEIDLEARNLTMMEKMLGRSPKKTKREAILKELLNDY